MLKYYLRVMKTKFYARRTKRSPPYPIEKINRIELSGKNEHEHFTIFKSSQESETSGSIIPPDIAICNQCLKELRDPKDPRYEYFFITCTDCGPRFTIIERLLRSRKHHYARISVVWFLPKRV
jgi:hydrogenase maturation factor HypF (carbamoyltransferase family)